MMREQALDNLMTARVPLEDAVHQPEMLQGDTGGEDEANGDTADGPGGEEDQQAGVGVTRPRRCGLCGLGSVLLLVVCAPLLLAWKMRRMP